MADIATDRWTCPACDRTVVVHGSPPDVAYCLMAAQLRHGTAHRAARLAALPQPRRAPAPTRRRATQAARQKRTA